MRPPLAVFAMAVVAQWFLPLAGAWRHDAVVSRGTLVRIECRAPDPYDPLRGRYLAVRPVEVAAPMPAGAPYHRAFPVWATLVAGEDGLARIESLSLEPVAGATVIRLVGRWPRWNRHLEPPTISIEWPFDRFYLTERLAAAADGLVARKTIVAEVRLLDGRAVLTGLLLDGVPVRELAERQAE